jgi:pyruvate,water dikinase
MPLSIIHALRAALSAEVDGGAPVAVRSSATAEDGAEVSYAGQYTSMLGLRDEGTIVDAVITCWRSFFSFNALVARAVQGALGESEAMAVLIQSTVDAECAGVCYTVDPVRHRPDLIVINAGWGLGVGVADGSVKADTTWVSRDTLTVAERRVVEKAAQVALDADGGVRRVPVPDRRRRTAVLPDPWVQRVAQFGVAAELLLGCPQDVEWAIAADQLWVLQSRPITALPSDVLPTARFPIAWHEGQDRRCLWTLERRSGRAADALYPLELDDVAAVERYRKETCDLLGADRNQQLKMCNGRIYVTPIPLDLTVGDMRVRGAWREDLKQRLWDQGLTAWDHWGPEIECAVERLRAFDPAEADGLDLARHLEDALAVRGRHFMIHPICWFKPQPSFLEAFERVSGLSGDAAEAAAHRLLDSVESPMTDLVDRLYALACAARDMPALAPLIADPPPDVLDRLAAVPQAAAFRTLLTELIEAYGERTGRGYGFEPTIMTPTWRDQPEQVLRLIATYLDPKVVSPAAARARAREQRDVRVDALCDACGNAATAAEFRRQLARARRWMAVLDYHNHYIDQVSLGRVRYAVLAAADWLVKCGTLPERDGIFWLLYDEILKELRAGSPSSLADTIAARQAQHADWATLEAPPILGVPPCALPMRPPVEEREIERGPRQAGGVMGLGASPGRYRGRARLVLDPVDLPALTQGDVLVAMNAAPRWTPFFPILGALVLDEGSLAQHAAATAREYGLPAVIDTRTATRRIADGAWVVVDGTAGTVEIDG